MSKQPIQSPTWLNMLLLGVAVYELGLLVVRVAVR
jgi:hypothetical protein